MDLKFKGSLVRVSSTHARVTCDECRLRHRKCDLGVPSCSRCLKLNLTCTRHLSKKIHKRNGLSAASWLLITKDVIPLTWERVIELYSKDFFTQYYLRRYLMPWVLLLPKPTKKTKIEDIRNKIFTMNFDHSLGTRSLPKYPASQIQTVFGEAIRVFFRVFNPFYPLFSEEGFFAKPRSLTLVKTVIQIGLERMPQTDLTRDAIRENNLVPKDFEGLPLSLDTLQSHLLILSGVWLPCFLKIREGFLKTIWCLPSLLGLHVPSFPHRFEGTLANQMLFYMFHHMSICQSVSMFKFTWFEISSEHLHPRFLKKQRFASPCDRLYFISSTTMYHSFVTVTCAQRVHTRALRDKAQALRFQQTLNEYIHHLDDNFKWGWNQLPTPSERHSTLLVQTRLNLVLRYHNDYLELMKLGMHIPLANLEPLSQEALTGQFTEYSQRGLAKAIRNVHLVATISPSAFDFNYIRTLIPALAFLMIHWKVANAKDHPAEPLSAALSLALRCLKDTLRVPILKATAESYLELFDFLAKHNEIKL